MKKLLLVILTLSGCATTGTNGVVEISPNVYMVGGLGGFTDYSSSGVKVRLYQEAAKFCKDKGLVVSPINSTGKDSGFATYASAEIQFSCVPDKT